MNRPPRNRYNYVAVKNLGWAGIPLMFLFLIVAILATALFSIGMVVKTIFGGGRRVTPIPAQPERDELEHTQGALKRIDPTQVEILN